MLSTVLNTLNLVVVIGHWQHERADFERWQKLVEWKGGGGVKSENKYNITGVGAETDITAEIWLRRNDKYETKLKNSVRKRISEGEKETS
jgi:hypothetical protein